VSPEPPCTLACSRRQPRQAEHSQALERVVGGGCRENGCAFPSCQQGYIDVFLLPACYSGGREIARVCSADSLSAGPALSS
jgi:hypothetical protein